MTIEEIRITSRAQWLALRQQDVTGSEVGALVGAHRYKTAAQLYAEKTTAIEPEEDDSPVMRRGHALEAFVASLVQEKLPEFSVTKSDTYYRDTVRHIGGTPDYLMTRQDGSHGILEIKTVIARDFVRKYQGGDKDADPLPELWQMLQILTYMYLTGASFGKIAIFVVGEFATFDDVHIIEIPRRKDVIDRVLFEVERFWKQVELKIPPDFDFTRDAAAVKALYPTSEKDKPIDLTKDNQILGQLARRALLKKEIKENEEEVKAIETEIKAKMGDAEYAIVNGGWKLGYKNEKRKGYTVEDGNPRVLRITKLPDMVAEPPRRRL